nr:RNA exonuclease 1 homolog isoform X1 [Oryctolagus cuniculus]
MLMAYIRRHRRRKRSSSTGGARCLGSASSTPVSEPATVRLAQQPMLPSAGYFCHFPCPFDSPRGGCQRLHCQFRHLEAQWELAEASRSSPLEELQVHRSPVESKGTAMEELEKINKEIEAVRTEVEESQRSPVNFTLALEELTQSPVASLNNTNVNQDFPKNDLLPEERWKEPSRNKDSQLRTYVMDHKCPATDLEYDPLPNYSAELLGTSKAEQDETDQQNCQLKKYVGENCLLPLKSQKPFSLIRIKINLQDSDDDELVIDAPPLMPTSKKSKLFRGSKCQNKDKKVNITPLEEKNLQISAPEEKNTGKSQLTTQIDDRHTSEPPPLLMETPLDMKNNVVLNPVKTHTSKKGSFGYEKDSYILEEGHKKTLKDSHNEHYVKSQKYFKSFYDTQNKETECPYSLGRSQISCSDERAKDRVLRAQNNRQESTAFADSKVTEWESGNEPAAVDIAPDSGNTMKACPRIPSESTENEAHKKTKQASGNQDMLNYRSTSGPKKRIAHTAKFDVPSSKEIVSSFRGPVPPPATRTGILRAQQQAGQMQAAGKSGQAFAAATSEHRKSAFACPASQTRRKENSFTSNSIQLDMALSKENPSGKTCKSHIPVRSIAAFPVKMPKYTVAHRKWTSVTSESSKVPDEVRQRYVSLFVERYLDVCQTKDEALNKAKIEEKAIYERCGSRNMYVNIAVNTLKKLREQAMSGSGNSETTGFQKCEKKNVLTGVTLYRHLRNHLLTEEQLRENNYPRPNPDKPGCVLLNPCMTKTSVNDASKKICCRCGKIYDVTPSGKHSRVEECYYHFGQVRSHKVLDGLESRYSCCGGVLGSPGCQESKLHVHDQKENLEGFVKTSVKIPPADGNYGVFAVNCEMCYTVKGLELTRVTVVDSSFQMVCDTFVKPDEEIIDYNTRFSGVVEDDLKNIRTSIRDVQAILLNLFSADTILIGHSFEQCLYALKLIHTCVVDTTVMFPHRLGLPHKRSLGSLVADYLQRIIQDDGHNTSEKAKACMELVLWKVKEDLKGKKIHPALEHL